MISPEVVKNLDKEKDKRLIDMMVRIEQGLDLLPPEVQDEALSEDLSSIDLDPVFSVSGFEFSKIFARERGFRLATAARMAATFPMITPAVLPPDPPGRPGRRLGVPATITWVELAADWIFQNREWLKEKTSGVVLIQIRCFGDPDSRFHPADTSGDWMGRGFQFLWSVPQAAANTFSIGRGHPQRPRPGPAQLAAQRFNRRAGRALLHDRGLPPAQLRPARPGKGHLARGPGRLVMEELGGLARGALLVADRFRGQSDPRGRAAQGRPGPDGRRADPAKTAR